MAENNNTLLTVLTVLVCLGLLLGFGMNLNLKKKVNALDNTMKELETPEVDLSAINLRLDSIEASLTTPVQSTEATTETSGSYVLTKREFERQTVEDKALELATEFVNSKDFKKDLFNFLNSSETDNSSEMYGYDLELYKDITEILVKDVNFNNSRDEVDFVVEVKFNEEVFDDPLKAKLEFSVDFDGDLDFDELEDLEVEGVVSGTFDLVKVKEI